MAIADLRRVAADATDGGGVRKWEGADVFPATPPPNTHKRLTAAWALGYNAFNDRIREAQWYDSVVF